MPTASSNIIDGINDVIDEKPYCEKHKMDPWCPELKEYVHDGRDSKHIHMNIENLMRKFVELDNDEPHVKLWVPIFPSDNAWLETRLEAWSPKLYQVIIVLPTVFDPIERVTLGVIGPGDGRLAVFYMFSDYLNMQNYKCQSTFHGYTQEKQWNAAMNSNAGQRMLVQWSMFKHNACPPCASRTNDDFGDLVPESNDRSWGSGSPF